MTMILIILLASVFTYDLSGLSNIFDKNHNK
jgi:hypothetical protein